MFIKNSSKFKVQSSKLTDSARLKFIAAHFCLLEVFHKTRYDPADFHRVPVKNPELFFGNVLLVKCDVKLITHFAARTFGICQKLNEFAIAFALKAFGDIRGYGN